MSRVLIADDQRDVLEALRILLKGEGHQTESVTSISGIFNALQQRDYALMMMDLNYTRDTTSGQEGLEVIPRIQERVTTGESTSVLDAPPPRSKYSPPNEG